MPHKQTKYILTTVMIIALTLLATHIYARAGGGGGSGAKGAGGIIALVIWGIYTVIVSVLLFCKTTSSKLILNKAFKQDQMWDPVKLKALSKTLFYNMQLAWMNRDIDSVKNFITDDLYADYKQQLDILRANNHKNVLESINVADVRIISCEDFNDNSKDSFIAYLKGSIVDYTINEKTGIYINNENREPENFTDTFHFVRKDNKWLLNYIDNDVTINDLITANNYKERQPTPSFKAGALPIGC